MTTITNFRPNSQKKTHSSTNFEWNQAYKWNYYTTNQGSPIHNTKPRRKDK